MTALRNALKNALDSMSGVNVALMRFSATGADGKQTSGGMVLHHFEPVETAREKLEAILDSDSLDPLETCLGADAPCMGAQGRKPIGETLYEAYLYYAGEPVDFGTRSRLSQQVACPSVPQSWGDGTAAPLAAPVGRYRSPTSAQVCNTDNYIVLVTDGFTEQDRSSDDDRIARLPKFSSTPYVARDGSCDRVVYADGNPASKLRYVVDGATLDEDLGRIAGAPASASQGSYCVDDLAGYLWSVGVGKKQSKVATYTIGLDLERFDATGNYGRVARRSLIETAIRGGGEYHDANDQADLESRFTTILRRILLENASFTSPSVAVNAFNRTQHRNDLYFSMFKPDLSYRWKGNLKRYRLAPTEDAADCGEGALCDPNDIRDRNDRDAVEIDNDAVLRFSAHAWSYWSDAADGFDAAAGGAAGEIKVPAERKIYSNLSADSGLLNEELSTLEVSAAGPATRARQQSAARHRLRRSGRQPALSRDPGQVGLWLRRPRPGRRAGHDRRCAPGHGRPAARQAGGRHLRWPAGGARPDGLPHDQRRLPARDRRRRRPRACGPSSPASCSAGSRSCISTRKSRCASTASIRRCARSVTTRTATAGSSRPTATRWCCTSACAAAAGTTSRST